MERSTGISTLSDLVSALDKAIEETSLLNSCKDETEEKAKSKNNERKQRRSPPIVE